MLFRSYAKLVAVLVEALKELKEEHEALEVEKDEEIATLKDYLCQKDPQAIFCE